MFNFFPSYFIGTYEISKIIQNRQSFTALVNVHVVALWSRYCWVNHCIVDCIQGIFDGHPRGTFGSRNIWGNVRLYWTLFGGTHHFFRGKEAEEAKKPHLEILGSNRQEGIDSLTLRVKIKNTGGSTAKRCYGTISITNVKEDIVDNDWHPTLIRQDNFQPVQDAELCWWRTGNPSKIDIPQKGTAELEIVKRMTIHPQLIEIFKIPSGEGWGGFRDDKFTKGVVHQDKFATVNLTPKKYTGVLTIYSDDSEPVIRNFTLGYDEQTKSVLLELAV